MAAAPRRGASIMRRDPCKGKTHFQHLKVGFERVEDPSRSPEAEPLAGGQGRALTAIASLSTRASLGSLATWTQARAGGFWGKKVA